MYVLSGDALKSVSNESQVSERLKSRYKTHKKKKRDTSRRAPRKSQKKARLVEFDSDTSSSDSDLSLGRRYSNIAIRISSDEVFVNLSDYSTIRKKFPFFNSLLAAKGFADKLEKISRNLFKSFKEYIVFYPDYSELMIDYKLILQWVKQNPDKSPGSFFIRSNTLYRQPRKDIEINNNTLNNFIYIENFAIENDYKLPRIIKIRDLIAKIKKDWEEVKEPVSFWGKKASILESIKYEIENGFNYPKEYVEFFITDPHDLKGIKDNISKTVNTIRTEGKIDLPKNIAEDDFVRFAALSSIYKSLCSNPVSPDFTTILKSVDEHTKELYKEVHELTLLNTYMEKYLENVKKFIGDEDEEEDITEFGDYDKIIDIIDHGSKYESGINLEVIEKAYYDFFVKEGKGIPKPLIDKFGKASEKTASVQSSNETGNDKMRKTAMYHGVLIQGGPDGPTNTGWKSIDKRYIGKKHYESILASARDMLKENPWFESNWQGGSSDAPVRAALDLAIATTDDAIYQSKIDSPTYEMLLNKLAGWEYDLMKDTVLNIHSNPKKRKASTDYDLMLNDLKYLK